MENKTKILTTLLVLFVLYGCFSYVDTIKIINNSNSDKIVCYSCSDSIGSKIDNLTLNAYFKQFDLFKYEIFDKNQYIKKDSTTFYRIPFPKKYLASGCEDGKVRFFFINDSVFLNYSWNTIVKYQMYEKKMIFSDKDLKKMNWTIVYKP